MKHQARGQPTEQRVDELATPPGTDRVVDLPSLDEVFARRGVLVRLAYRLCWNIEDAEDAVQNALLLASEKRHQLADARRLWSWVRAIVVRQCHEVRRRLARQQQADTVREPARRPTPCEEPVVDKADRREFDGLVKRMIGTLPERQQTALVLRHLEAMSYRQVAEIMGTSESTARVQVRNARQALRGAILERYPAWAMDAKA